MSPSQYVCVLSLSLFSGGLAAQFPESPQSISGYAFIEEDGNLRINGQRIRLYGIYIPPTERSCMAFIRPMPCAPRAVLALEFKISGDFVRCNPRSSVPDGSITASCRSGEEDLSQWMLQRGWAVSLPDAPFEYAAMERIARARGFGIWGIPVERFSPP